MGNGGQHRSHFRAADASALPLKKSQSNRNLSLRLRKIIISTSFQDEKNFHSSLAEHYRGHKQQGVDIIELKLVSHGNDTLFNLMLCSDWAIISLIPSLEKRLKRGPSIRLPTIKSLIEDIILALRDNEMVYRLDTGQTLML